MNGKRNSAKNPDEPSRMMTPRQTAEYIGVAPSTLLHWRVNRVGPPFHRYPSTTARNAPVRYLRAEVDEFLRKNRFNGS